MKNPVWLTVVTALVASTVSGYGAYVKGKVDQQDLEIRARAQSLEESKAQVARYDFVSRVLIDITRKDTTEQVLLLNIARLALDSIEERGLFTGFAVSGDTVLRALGQTAIATIRTEPAFRRNASYQVGFYAREVEAVRFKVATDSIMRRGFNVIKASIVTDKPQWMCERSCVLFYSANTRGIAEELASMLSQIAGDTFNVARGGGTGVPSGEEHRSLRIHWVVN